MNEKLKLLILEDFEEDVKLLQFTLLEGGIDFESRIVETKIDYEEALENFMPDAILCDHTLPQFDSIRALKILRRTKRNIPFILVTGSVSEEFAVQMIQAGAHDYIIKDRMTRLPSALMNALQKCKVENERIKYFEELIANEQLFKRAEKIAHFGVWERAPFTNTAKWSDEIYRMLGFEPGEVEPTYENFLRNVYPEDVERIDKLVSNAVQNKDSDIMFFRIKDDSGNIKLIKSEFVIDRDENNNPVKITGFNLDITEQNRTEENLRKSLKETSDYRYAIDQSAIVAITDQKGIIKYANDNFCRISQYTLKELIGQDHRLVNSGYHPKMHIKNLWKMIANGKVWSGEFCNRAKDGSLYWVDTTIIPFLDENKKPYQYVSIRYDITERKIAEENLIQNEHKFRQFFEAAPEAILILDTDKKVFVDFNENALKLLNYSHEELMNKSPLEVTAAIQPEGTTNLEKMITNIERIKAGEKLTTEWLVIDSAGKEIFTEIRSSILSDYDKNLMRLSIIDITDRKNHEIEKEKITNDLFTRNQDLEQFTYIVSHNLRAPVANIIGFSEELNNKDLSGNERDIITNELNSSIKRLDDVLRDLNEMLNVNRVTNQKKEKISLDSVAYDVKAALKDLIQETNSMIEFDFTNAPELFSIRSYLHSIFLSLITNSIKFRRADVHPVININSYYEANKLVLTFKDNGLGIDIALRGEQLFGLYKRFHSNIQGKGVGLFMVKAQVIALGGSISASSKVNEGTTFKIEFNILQ